MKKMIRMIPLLLALLCMACEKKELPATKYDRGDVLGNTAGMGPDYKNQVWFSLSGNKVISTNLRTDWDIAFECSPDGYQVILNSSKAMRALKTNAGETAAVKDTLGLAINGKADSPTGNLDSTAIGSWKEDNKVYVIHRGYNEIGLQQGYYKLKIKDVSANGYSFEYGDMSGKTTYTAEVNKNSSYSFVAFSFGSGRQLSIEPRREEYDLCFTQYTHLFYDPYQYYQVTGILLNSYRTRAAKFVKKEFATLSLADTAGAIFSSRANAIGYEWKSFDLNNNLYTVDPKLCYIIQDSRGFFYKLHFVDFYSSSGLKGFPRFEFRKL